jgi:hypothetical protein
MIVARLTRSPGFGGYVAQYLGYGIMAFFSWPEAHDNDVE